MERGPCVNVLPDILMINEMQKTVIRQAQRAAVEPPLLLDNDESSGWNVRTPAGQCAELRVP